MCVSMTKRCPMRAIGYGIEQAAYSTYKFTEDALFTLGKRGSDGQPLALKVLSAVTKILKDFERYERDIYARGMTKFVEYASKPLSNVGTVFAPLTGFEGLIKEVSNFSLAMFEGKVEKKFKLIQINTDNTGKETKLVIERKSKEKACDLVKAEVAIKTIATVSGWLSDLANAIAKVAELNFFNLEKAFLSKVSLVGSLCARVFAYVGAGGTIIKFSLAAYRHFGSQNVSKEERAVLEASFKQAAVDLAKTAVRISLLVFAPYFSLSMQGALALGMIGLDIYVDRKVKDKLIPTRQLKTTSELPVPTA